jgi:hypothetical protein
MGLTRWWSKSLSRKRPVNCRNQIFRQLTSISPEYVIALERGWRPRVTMWLGNVVDTFALDEPLTQHINEGVLNGDPEKRAPTRDPTTLR